LVLGFSKWRRPGSKYSSEQNQTTTQISETALIAYKVAKKQLGKLVRGLAENSCARTCVGYQVTNGLARIVPHVKFMPNKTGRHDCVRRDRLSEQVKQRRHNKQTNFQFNPEVAP
jgi:hypothetical protein